MTIWRRIANLNDMEPDALTAPYPVPLIELLAPGGARSLADIGEVLGVTKGAVHEWTRRGYVPAARVEDVADALALPQDVREELRRRARRARRDLRARDAVGGVSISGGVDMPTLYKLQSSQHGQDATVACPTRKAAVRRPGRMSGFLLHPVARGLLLAFSAVCLLGLGLTAMPDGRGLLVGVVLIGLLGGVARGAP